MDKPKDAIEIFSTDDEKIKAVGELLTNDSSRAILQLLFKEELTATQISQKTDISLQLVKYHINKMQDLKVIKVSKVEKNSKNQDMNYYTATKFAIVIVPSAVSERAKESKQLVRSFKTIYRMLGFSAVSIVSWFALAKTEEIPVRGEIVEATIDPLQIIIPVIIIAVGIIIESVLYKKRKKENRV